MSTIKKDIQISSGDDLSLVETSNASITAIANTYISAATSENTRKAYRQDIRHFMLWGGLLPATHDVILRYLYTYAETLNSRTLSRRLTAIKNWHLYQGFLDPTSHPLIKKTLKGIQNIHGRPKEKAQALTILQLNQLIDYLHGTKTLQALRDSALLQVGFFGALRRSELINIQWEHIHFVPEGMEIMIPRSKTDQTGEGQICAIPYGHDTLCAVNALTAWCEAAGIHSGYIFRAINRHQQINHTALTARSVNLIIKSLAKKCGLPQSEKYSGHSLRRGFATAASKKGAPFVAIMRHGRWKHEGTVLGYIEEGQRFEENVAGMLMEIGDK